MEQRELLARLGATPKILAQLVVEADDARLDEPAPGGGWSARTILAHLRDDEFLCMRPALERLLALNEPEIAFLEGDEGWEAARNRARDRKETLLADFALQRQATLNVFACMRDIDWARTGTMAGSDPVTALELLAAWVRHDTEHIAQLEAVLGETLSEVLARRSHPHT